MNYYHRRVRAWCEGDVEEGAREGLVDERDTAEVASVAKKANVGEMVGTEEGEERETELPPFAGMLPPVRVKMRVLVPRGERERLRVMVVNVRKIRLRVVVSKTQ